MLARSMSTTGGRTRLVGGWGEMKQTTRKPLLMRLSFKKFIAEVFRVKEQKMC